MKIICSKSDLVKGVNIALKAVPVRTTLPILECILIDASDDQIRLVANDMELGIETVIPGEISEKGKIALDAKIFSEIVRKLPDNDVVIETEKSLKTWITCEKAKFTIVGKDGDEFSVLPYVERDKSLVLSQFTLKEVIKQTIFSTADNESNKIMTGELFSIKENILKVVSLDGHRISIRNIELPDVHESQDLIVPGKTLQEISKILTGEIDQMADIYYTKNHILFDLENTVVISRLIDGNYFAVDQMLSSDYETKIKISKKDLLDCIERASLLIRDSDGNPIVMDISDELMELSLNSSIGSMDETIDIEKQGKDVKIGFNPKYFIEALRVIDDEEVILYMINSKAPCFIKDDAGSYIYLILPVNLRG